MSLPPELPDILPVTTEHARRIASYAARSLAPATISAYRADLAKLAAFCRAHGLSDTMPWSANTVAAYLAHYARAYAYGSLVRLTRAVLQAHRAAGLPFDRTDPVIRHTLRGIAKAHGTPPRRAAALGTREVRAMVAACPRDLRGIRDVAILLTGFAGALRRSEIVGLDREHLTFMPDGMRLLIARSKTDPSNQGAEIMIPKGKNRQTCPVRAVEHWLETAAIEYGPLFRGIDRWGTVEDRRLHPDGVRRIVRAAAERAGIGVAAHEGLSPHGLRAGFITEAYRAGAREEDIMQHTRHRSAATMRGYVRRSNKLSDNPARLLGL